MNAEIEELIAQRVAEAIAAYQANGNGGHETGANDAAGNVELPARGCTHKAFQGCNPRNFHGTEGAVGLIRWFEKLESVFRLCECAENCKVKYATSTLQDEALTWWNAYAQSVGIDAAFGIPWEELKRVMTAEYCPRNEVQKLESEFWNLTMQGNDIAKYTSRFHELALLCPTLVTPEYKKIERYIWGLIPEIQGNVTSSKPATIHDTIRMAHELVDQVVRQQSTIVKNDNKRKWEENPGKGHGQQNKRVESSEDRKPYDGKKPYCNKCNFYHYGNCGDPCERCLKLGHLAKDCRSPAPVKNNEGVPKTCFKCGKSGHIKRDCPELKDQDIPKARARVYFMGTREGTN